MSQATRLDRASWRPMHNRILLALGIGWALDSFEVQIIGSVLTPLATRSLGSQIGALWKGWRPRLVYAVTGLGLVSVLPSSRCSSPSVPSPRCGGVAVAGSRGAGCRWMRWRR